jgi:hypothetical protein
LVKQAVKGNAGGRVPKPERVANVTRMITRVPRRRGATPFWSEFLHDMVQQPIADGKPHYVITDGVPES